MHVLQKQTNKEYVTIATTIHLSFQSFIRDVHFVVKQVIIHSP